MSRVICKLCGRITSTAVSVQPDDKLQDQNPAGCYAAWSNDQWVAGCRYDSADHDMKYFVNRLLGRSDSDKK